MVKKIAPLTRSEVELLLDGIGQYLSKTGISYEEGIVTHCYERGYRFALGGRSHVDHVEPSRNGYVYVVGESDYFGEYPEPVYRVVVCNVCRLSGRFTHRTTVHELDGAIRKIRGMGI